MNQKAKMIFEDHYVLREMNCYRNLHALRWLPTEGMEGMNTTHRLSAGGCGQPLNTHTVTIVSVFCGNGPGPTPE